MTAILSTTANLAREADACEEDYRKVSRAVGGRRAYGGDTPVGLDLIAEVAGLNAALWALRCVVPEQRAEADRFGRLFACRCAFRVLPIAERDPDDRRPREAIRAARRFARGEATEAELAAAWDAARAAARAAARDAAWAAAGAAARDARAAARAAARDAAGATAGVAAGATAGVAAGAAARDAARDAAWAEMTRLFIAAVRGEIDLDEFPGLDEAPVAASATA